MFIYFSDISFDGLEPIMLDETWGLSNHTTKYSGRYSKYGYMKNEDATSDIATNLKEKFGNGNLDNLHLFII